MIENSIDKLLAITTKSSPISKGHDTAFICSPTWWNWGPLWNQTRAIPPSHNF